MNNLTEKVMASCSLSEQDAVSALRNETELLMSSDEPDITDFCDSLGLDEEDIFSNPEAILAYL